MTSSASARKPFSSSSGLQRFGQSGLGFGTRDAVGRQTIGLLELLDRCSGIGAHDAVDLTRIKAELLQGPLDTGHILLAASRRACWSSVPAVVEAWPPAPSADAPASCAALALEPKPGTALPIAFAAFTSASNASFIAWFLAASNRSKSCPTPSLVPSPPVALSSRPPSPVAS